MSRNLLVEKKQHNGEEKISIVSGGRLKVRKALEWPPGCKTMPGVKKTSKLLGGKKVITPDWKASPMRELDFGRVAILQLGGRHRGKGKALGSG